MTELWVHLNLDRPQICDFCWNKIPRGSNAWKCRERQVYECEPCHDDLERAEKAAAPTPFEPNPGDVGGS